MGQTTPPPPQVVVVRQGHSGCFWFLIFLLIAIVIVGIIIFLSVMGILGALSDSALPGRQVGRLSGRLKKWDAADQADREEAGQVDQYERSGLVAVADPLAVDGSLEGIEVAPTAVMGSTLVPS